MIAKYFAASFFVLSFLLLSGCSEESPETMIEEYLILAEKYAEGKDAPGIRKLIAKDYSDDRDLTRQDLTRIAVGYFYRKKALFVERKTRSILLDDNGKRATVYVLAAVTGEPVDGNETKLLQAEIHAFSAKLKNVGGDWKLYSLDWKRLSLDDFLEE